MRSRSGIALAGSLIIIASLLAGCSKEPKQNDTVPKEASAPPQPSAPAALEKQRETVQKETTASLPPSTTAPSEKRLEDMTAMEVAQDPPAYGFEKGGSMRTDPTEAGLRAGMKPSRDDQWTKKTSDGKLYILTIHYEDDKLVSAQWGGV